MSSSAHNRIGRKELLAELRHVAEKLGESPSKQQFVCHSKYSDTPYYREFNSFVEARELAGVGDIDRTPPNKIDRQDLIDELARLDGQLDRVPYATDIKELSKYSRDAFYNEFGSIPDAREAAGLPREVDAKPSNFLSRQELLDEVRRLNDELGYPPSASDMNDEGRYTAAVYRKTWSTWREVVEAAGLDKWAVDVGIIRDKQSLIDEIQRVAEIVDRVPSKNDLVEHGRYSTPTYYRKFESWRDAVRKAGYEPYEWQNPPRKSDSDGAFLPYGPNWGEQRQAAFDEYGHGCYICGMSIQEHLDRWGAEPSMHHLTPRRRYVDDDGDFDWERANRVDNLVPYCKRHHGRWDRIPLRPQVNL